MADDLAWLDALDCTADAESDIDALMDWMASPAASSDFSVPDAPFVDFWEATTTKTTACQTRVAGQHESSPAAGQQNSKLQVVPDAPWPFPTDPILTTTSQPLDLMVCAQQDSLRPVAEHAAAPSLLSWPSSSVPSPPPAVTAAPAGPFCAPHTAGRSTKCSMRSARRIFKHAAGPTQPTSGSACLDPQHAA